MKPLSHAERQRADRLASVGCFGCFAAIFTFVVLASMWITITVWRGLL